MIGRRGSSLVVLAVALAAACTRNSGPAASSGGGSFDRTQILRALGSCALATYEEFAIVAAELDSATAGGDREIGREAWKRAIDVWQRAELFQFGPAATATSVGGMDMRDGIYSWPLVGQCLIDSQLVAETYAKPEFDAALVSTKGLAAIEYLLFGESTTNSCAPSSAINAQGTWAALGDVEIARRRAAYAHAAAVEVSARARRLVDAWAEGRGNFLGKLATPGNEVFASQQMAFNAVSNAMFYLDLRVKNDKVGIPAGLLPDCGATSCPERVESAWAKRAKVHLRSNVTAYESLLHGCKGKEDLAFDDLLRAVGAEHVTAKLEATVVEIRVALDALGEPTLEEDIQKNPASVLRLFDALRANSTVMKAEMATVLDLELPKEALTDND
jgi:uncharacterized protein